MEINKTLTHPCEWSTPNAWWSAIGCLTLILALVVFILFSWPWDLYFIGVKLTLRELIWIAHVQSTRKCRVAIRTHAFSNLGSTLMLSWYSYLLSQVLSPFLMQQIKTPSYIPLQVSKGSLIGHVIRNYMLDLRFAWCLSKQEFLTYYSLGWREPMSRERAVSYRVREATVAVSSHVPVAGGMCTWH